MPSSDDPIEPGPAPLEPEPLRNSDETPRVVLAAVDTSPAAERVVAMAARFVRAFPEASLHLLHVLRFSRMDRGHAGLPALGSHVVDEAKDYLDFHRRQF